MANTYPACPLPRPIGAEGYVLSSVRKVTSGFIEGGHQLEKLEFALAVAVARGDRIKVDQLRSQISALGGEGEEPGT
ncbi:hypothetical protein KBY66_07115 [Synechococcus sp. Tobar12-5m-g]|jgi:hypothetical protein|uniref:hypothetical protein n=1 Tax=unclassified Synechococcus TaxID=2626047 RepID=UPI0020CCC65F|nr:MULTISPECIES: hypothetical protein [unclassified Synechococcus]MCP9772395.1 hypothetical protein [Synechococcus sp. Tobar12-5m-g]MCP9873982.1 hypothetical protein [Synechococcus sp. Cruz CV-v-12]